MGNLLFSHIILHIKWQSKCKQEISCFFFHCNFTWRIIWEKSKVPILTQILLWGLALGLKWKLAKFEDVFECKKCRFTSLPFPVIYYELHCTTSKIQNIFCCRFKNILFIFLISSHISKLNSFSKAAISIQINEFCCSTSSNIRKENKVTDGRRLWISTEFELRAVRFVIFYNLFFEIEKVWNEDRLERKISESQKGTNVLKNWPRKKLKKVKTKKVTSVFLQELIDGN